ncbi:MAG TPA: hypothetical protein VHD56_08855 [Tepidisphaeraceae bacterium]|nr:hypothetical protein [Tepidisphaeraceae bacterium]
MIFVILPILVLLAIAILLMVRAIFTRGLQIWLPQYLRETGKRCDVRSQSPIHLLLCIADHFEPRHGNASRELAAERVQTWVREYPRLFGHFRDSDGRPPQHTFFYPMEMYEPSHLDALAELRQQGFGDVEIHLHHDRDTSENLRQRLEHYKQVLFTRHGLLSRRKIDGEIVYGFVHGDWALDNSHPQGRCCGVNNELDVLRETGCYADFTLPSAPSATQTRKINSIYYAVDDPAGPKSHDWGTDVGCGLQPERSLMLIQGPLLFNWRNRKLGIIPRIENGCIQHNQAPNEQRLNLWLRARVQIPARPDWYFVKLHAHGAAAANQPMMLGGPMVRFHEMLAARAKRDPNFHFHYLTAREMYNLVRAAESGWAGTVEQARNFELICTPHSISRTVTC